MTQFKEKPSDIWTEGKIELKLEKTTQIDGFAIGASATPGEYYALIKKIFTQPPEVILPRLKAMDISIAQFTYLLCQYKFNPTQEISVPWTLLRDHTIFDFIPFGCGKKKTTLDVIVWFHLTNINYLGLFNDVYKPTISPTFGTMRFAELPLYPIAQLKSIAYQLIISDPSPQLLTYLIDWLKMQDDIYGYLENEPETLLRAWQSPPLNLSSEKITKIVEILVNNHPKPEIFKNSLSSLQ